jgi:hypothetical protein
MTRWTVTAELDAENLAEAVHAAGNLPIGFQPSEIPLGLRKYRLESHEPLPGAKEPTVIGFRLD